MNVRQVLNLLMHFTAPTDSQKGSWAFNRGRWYILWSDKGQATAQSWPTSSTTKLAPQAKISMRFKH